MMYAPRSLPCYSRSNLRLDKTFGNHHVTFTGVYEHSKIPSRLVKQMTGNQSSNDIETMFGATNAAAFSTKSENLLICRM